MEILQFFLIFQQEHIQFIIEMTNGCDTSETITLNNPPDLSGVISITSQVSCFGVCDGVLDFQVDNILTGTAPYTYSIDGGPYQNSSTFSSLCGNTTYSITVQDANGCTFTANKFISTPTEVSFSYTTSDYNGFNISCAGFSDGEITFNASHLEDKLHILIQLME